MTASIDSVVDSISDWLSSWGSSQDGDQQSCPIEGLDAISQDPAFPGVCVEKPLQAPPEAIKDLADHRVHPDTFHLEKASKQYASLRSCDSIDIALFKSHQQLLAHQIGTMQTDAIAAKLTELYEAAYRYDPDTQLMDVADPSTKQELDLWIAVIDHQAFQDNDFLNRIITPEIELIMTLNSPELQPVDRGTFHRFSENEISFKEYYRTFIEGNFKWLDKYDGSQHYADTSYWRSQNELSRALIIWLGKDALIKQKGEHYPKKMARQYINHPGLEDQRMPFSGLKTEEAIEQITDVLMALEMRPNAKSTQELVKEWVLLTQVLESRGVNYEQQVRELAIEQMVALGLTKPDAQLLAETPIVKRSASRLDDYEARQIFLEKYRELYAEFLSTPISERFSAEKQQRYNNWGYGILSSRHQSGVPMLLSDLQSIRQDVQRKESQIGSKDTKVAWKKVFSSNLDVPLWIRPEDITFSNESDPEIRNMMQSELIADNVEYMAILPPSKFDTPHAIAIAHGLFGAMVLQSGKFYGKQGWSEAIFKATVRHEAAHLDWFNKHFSEQPNKLGWLAANELYAHKITLHSLDEDSRNKSLSDYDRKSIESGRAKIAQLVRTTNERLGLAPDNFDRHFTFIEWMTRDDASFGFQPAFFITAERVTTDDSVKFRGWSDKELSSAWEKRRDAYVKALAFSPDEEKSLKIAIASLDKLKGKERSPIYRQEHPFLRFYNALLNDIQVYTGVPNPGVFQSIALSGDQWQNLTDLDAAIFLGENQAYDNMIAEWKGLAEKWFPFLDDMVRSDRLRPYQVRRLSNDIYRLDRRQYKQVNPLKASNPLLRIINKMRKKQGFREIDEMWIQNPKLWLQTKIFLVQTHLHDSSKSTRNESRQAG